MLEADIIEAKDGDDYIEGGRGSYILKGGKGNDTYYFGINHGADTIEDIKGIDTILFGKGINKDDITLRTDGDNLFVSVNNKGTMIKVENWNKCENAIEYIRFEDNKNVILQKEDILLLIEKNRQKSNILNDKEITNRLENKENSNILEKNDINNNKEVQKSNPINFDFNKY